MTDLWDDLGPKRLQIFEEMLPALKRVILIYNANDGSHSATMLRQNREAARQLGITLVERPVRNEAEAAPDFTLPSHTGGDVSVKQYRGKRLVLVEFFGAAFAPT